MKKPEILKSEMKLELAEMNRIKAAMPDVIVIKMLSTIHDHFRMDKIRETKYVCVCVIGTSSNNLLKKEHDERCLNS